MRFEATATIDYPRDLVVATLIERMDELVSYMPNVASIETDTVERRPDGTIETVRRWQGTAKTIPRLIRPFVTKNSLRWVDTSQWIPEEGSCSWVVTSKHSKINACTGVNRFVPHPDAPETRTLLEIAGDFIVHGDKIPAMPGFMGRRIAPRIEKIVIGFMLPNIRDMAVGANGLLASIAGAGDQAAS